MIKFLVDRDDLYYKILVETISDELGKEKCGYILSIRDVFKVDLVVMCGNGDFPRGLLWTINMLKKPLILYHASPETSFVKKASWIVSPRPMDGYDYFPSPVLISDLATQRQIERIWDRERLVSKRGSIGIVGLTFGEEQRQKLIDALNLLIEDLDLNVVFVPILKGELDKDISIKYSANVRSIETNRYSSKEILGILSRLDILITSDERGIICAMAVDRPVVGLAISDELDQFLSGIIEEDILFDIDKLSSDELYSKIKIAWVHRDTITKQMRGHVTDLKKKAAEGVRRLSRWISQ